MAVRRNSRTEPTKRTLAYLAAHGWIADIAERRTGPITRDLFGCIDVVAFKAGFPPLLIQVTSHNGGNMAKREAKVRAEPRTRELLAAEVSIQIWGWVPEKVDPRVITIEFD